MTREILIKKSECIDFLIDELGKTKEFRCIIGSSTNRMFSVKAMIGFIHDRLNKRSYKIIDSQIVSNHFNERMVFSDFQTDNSNVIFESARPTHLVFFGFEDLSLNDMIVPVLKSNSVQKIILMPVYDYGEGFVKNIVNNFKFN